MLFKRFSTNILLLQKIYSSFYYSKQHLLRMLKQKHFFQNVCKNISQKTFFQRCF